jgi:hypothetical protein
MGKPRKRPIGRPRLENNIKMDRRERVCKLDQSGSAQGSEIVLGNTVMNLRVS